MSTLTQQYTQFRKDPSNGAFSFLVTAKKELYDEITRVSEQTKKETKEAIDKTLDTVRDTIKANTELATEEVVRETLSTAKDIIKTNTEIATEEVIRELNFAFENKSDQAILKVLRKADELISTIKKGSDGKDGISVDEDVIISKVISKISKRKDGASQKPSNFNAMVNRMVEESIAYHFTKNPIKEIKESDIEKIVKKSHKEFAVEDFVEPIARAMEKLAYEKKLDYDTGLKNKPTLQKEKKTSSGARMGRGTGNATKYYDLSSQLNGVLKTFTIPSNLRVIDVRSSSTPIAFRQTTDYTYTSTSITFTDEISASTTLATGQTLYIIYAEA